MFSFIISVDGTCYGINNGSISIALVAAACEGTPPTNAHLGWLSSNFLLITEILPSSNTQGSFCYQIKHFSTMQ